MILNDLEQSEQKLSKVSRLYAFISQVNQKIVRVKDEDSLFQNACTIAVDFGKFKTAWIGLFDKGYNTISLVEQHGISTEDISLFENILCDINSPPYHVLRSGEHYLFSEDDKEFQAADRNKFATKYAIQSNIVLPIKKAGKIIGTFNLSTTETNFFDTEEITLLKGVTDDIGFAVDMFEKARKHKLAEDLVIQNEKRFRALIEKSPDLKKLSTVDGQTIYCSPSMTTVFGYSFERLLQASNFEFIHPKDVKAFKKNWEEIAKTPGASFNTQCRVAHKNGTWIPCEGTVTNLLNQSGIHAMLSNFRDVSKRELSEQQQEFDKTNLLALINNTQDLMWSVDTEFNLITSNQAFDDIVKQMSKQVISKGSNVLFLGFSVDQLVRFKAFYERAFAGEAFTEIEHSESEQDTWSEISFYPLRKGDEVIGTACYSRDITQRIIQHAELEMQMKLEIKNKELEQFAYIASHDLQEPLRTISNYVSLFKDDYLPLLDDNARKYLEAVNDGIGRMSLLISSLLEFSRLGINKTLKLINCKELIDDVLTDLQLVIKTSHTNIDVGKMPILEAYETELRQVFQNLIANAIKFRKKDVQLYIRIKSVKIKDTWQFSVSDNGIGIEAVHFTRIFDIFQRLHSVKEYAGSGIGLANCRKIIELHQGEIWLESIFGQGTTFYFTLPILKHE